jgi:hypothetical protein
VRDKNSAKRPSITTAIAQHESTAAVGAPGPATRAGGTLAVLQER